MSPTLLRLIIVVALTMAGLVGFRVWKAWSLRRSTRLMQALGETGHLTLMYFSGPNCAQCGAQEAVVAEIRGSAPDVVIESYDATVATEVAARVGVMSVPTTVIVDGTGRVVARNGRYVNAEVLRGQLEGAGLGSAQVS